ncbi:ead/Ea22-like family protein, partial [Enterobacter cloacae complex sp. ECNIH14]|uniref:ead/Ea22-like family protein n=1 Tax=Enterobacter cloacae complex sp. ECNIH14 TaxID=2080664 RepID=UPI000CDD1C39
MSNIDKRALREAAERAGQNDWEYVYTSDLSAPGRGYITVGGAEAIYCLNRATGGVKQSENVMRYIAAARPEKMLALLDEMEAAENLAKQQGNIAVELFDEVTTLRRNADDKAPELRSQLEEAERRIAELEARTLVPVEPTLDQLVAGKRRLTSTGRMSRLMSQRLA